MEYFLQRHPICRIRTLLLNTRSSTIAMPNLKPNLVRIQLMFLIVSFFMILPTFGQVGMTFPDLPAETVENVKEQLPGSTKGKFTLVGIAYSEDAEKDLRSWYDPVYNLFIDKSGMYELIYDVNVRMVLMFPGLTKVAMDKAKQNMKANTDPSLYPYVLFYGGEFKPYKTSLKLKDKSKPYIFVLDENGKIIYATSGGYSEKKLDEIGELVELD